MIMKLNASMTKCVPMTAETRQRRAVTFGPFGRVDTTAESIEESPADEMMAEEVVKK